MRELSNDELGKLSNEDLRNLFLEVRTVINLAKKRKTECISEEIYICYICREMTNREKTKK